MAGSSDDGKLGDLAVKRGWITADQLVEALASLKEAKERGEALRIGQVLLRKRWINTGQLAELLQTQMERAVPEERYEIIEELGRGGMAVVYKARDRKLGREVALKVLRREYAQNEAVVARMTREGKAIATVEHGNVVKLHDVGEHAGTPFLVMEYVSGRTLEEEWRGSSGMNERVREVRDIAEGVGAAHARGIVHRDLKPGNVMIEGEKKRVVVMDFGLAHVEEGGATLTRTGAVVGTPLYMAPEQVRGERRMIDARTDVYALGVMLYEATTGKAPYQGTMADVYEKILHEEPASPRTVKAEVPEALDRICQKAMAKERADRYADAGEMARDLNRFLTGETVRTSKTRIWKRVGRKAARNRGLQAALLTLALLLAGALWLGDVVRRGKVRAGEIGDRMEIRVAMELCLETTMERSRAGDRAGVEASLAKATRMAKEYRRGSTRDAGIQLLIGKNLRAAMRYPEAKDPLDEACRIAPDATDARRERAMNSLMLYEEILYRGADRWMEREFERMSEWSTDDPPGVRVEAWEDGETAVLRRSALEDLRGSTDPLGSGLVLALERKYAEAKERLGRVKGGDLDAEIGFLWLGRAETGFESAAIPWNAVVKRHRGWYSMYRARGMAGLLEGLRRWRAGQAGGLLDKAAADFSAWVKLVPENLEATRRMAEARIFQARYRMERGEDAETPAKAALAAMEPVVKMHPSEGSLIRLLAMARTCVIEAQGRRKGNPDLAMINLALGESEAALKLDMKSYITWSAACETRQAALYSWRWDGLHGLAIYERTLPDCEKVLYMHPGSVRVLEVRARLQQEWALDNLDMGLDSVELFNAALQDYDSLVRLCPSNRGYALARIVCGALLAGSGTTPADRAVELLAGAEAAIGLQGAEGDTDGRVLKTRGVVRMGRARHTVRLGQNPWREYKDAQENLQAAGRKIPWDGQIPLLRLEAFMEYADYLVRCKSDPDTMYTQGLKLFSEYISAWGGWPKAYNLACELSRLNLEADFLAPRDALATYEQTTAAMDLMLSRAIRAPIGYLRRGTLHLSAARWAIRKGGAVEAEDRRPGPDGKEKTVVLKSRPLPDCFDLAKKDLMEAVKFAPGLKAAVDPLVKECDEGLARYRK